MENKKAETKPNGWHNTHPEVDQLWFKGVHVGSLAWTNLKSSGFFGVALNSLNGRAFTTLNNDDKGN